jgi:cytochrome c553
MVPFVEINQEMGERGRGFADNGQHCSGKNHGERGNGWTMAARIGVREAVPSGTVWGTAPKTFSFATALLVGASVLWGTSLSAEDAASLYKTKCAACHGGKSAGDTAIGRKLELHDLSSPEV